MGIKVAPAVQAWVARQWLTDRCRIERWSGAGGSAVRQVVAVDVPYRREVAPTGVAAIGVPGGQLAEGEYRLRFAVAQDVRAGDIVIDQGTQASWSVVDVIEPSLHVLKTARAVSVR